jgi:hypothetical protein
MFIFRWGRWGILGKPVFLKFTSNCLCISATGTYDFKTVLGHTHGVEVLLTAQVWQIFSICQQKVDRIFANSLAYFAN